MRAQQEKPQTVCWNRPMQAIPLEQLVLASSLRATAAAPLFAALAVPLCAVSIVQMSMSPAQPASHGENKHLHLVFALSAALSVVPAAQAASCGSAAIRPNR